MKKEETFWSKLFSGSGWAVFTMFVWELVEEGIEQLIAVAISSAVALFITKALSTLAIITATQGIKVLLKRSLVPFIKTFTYKKGNDKMTKIKQFLQWIYANKKTLAGTTSAAVAVASGTGIIPVSSLPALLVNGFNLTPILFYGLLGIFILIGVFGKGLESVQAFFERIGVLKAEKEQKQIEKEAAKELKAEEKEQKRIEKEAAKELKAEEKVANQNQAEEEKAKAKKDAEDKAKADKEAAEAERRAKIDAVKAQLKQKGQEETISTSTEG